MELTAKVQAAEDAKAAALAQVKKAQKELADAMQEAQDLHVQVQQLAFGGVLRAVQSQLSCKDLLESFRRVCQVRFGRCQHLATGEMEEHSKRKFREGQTHCGEVLLSPELSLSKHEVTDLTLNLKEAKADAKAGWAAHSESDKQLKIEKKNVLDVKDELFKTRDPAHRNQAEKSATEGEKVQHHIISCEQRIV